MTKIFCFGCNSSGAHQYGCPTLDIEANIDLQGFNRGFVTFHDGVLDLAKERNLSVIPIEALTGYLKSFMSEDEIGKARE